jgi:hypothetical protein
MDLPATCSVLPFLGRSLETTPESRRTQRLRLLPDRLTSRPATKHARRTLEATWGGSQLEGQAT